MRIIPWVCHICGNKFGTGGGGLCFRCKRPTCIEDLRLVDYAEKKGAPCADQISCRTCLKPGEPAIHFEKRFGIPTSWGRSLTP